MNKPTAILLPLLVVSLLWSVVLPASAKPAEPEAERLADIEKRISRLLLIGFEGRTPADLAGVRMLAADRPLGGYLILRRNVRDAGQLRTLIKALDDASPEPQLFAVDEEGGAVRRLRGVAGVPATPSARALALKSVPEAFERYLRLAEALHGLGINLNLGPVVDLDTNRDNPAIGRLGRSYGADPRRVADYAKAFIRAHGAFGIEAAVKHFPGHGSTVTDPHHGPADAVESWSPLDLVPFRLVIAEESPSFVMTSHITYASSLVGQHAPIRATFSRPLIGYLRSDLGFSGLVISDDLTMGAVSADRSLEDNVADAILAGHDLVIIASPDLDPAPEVSRLIENLARRAARDPELEEAIATASERVRLYKAARLP